MSLITALNPGLTGILSQQKQVEITGNNIANVNTPGYSRQTATLSPKAAVNIQGLLMGQGVEVEDVSREYDKFVTGQIEDQNSVLGKESAKNGPLAELERIFSIGEDSLASDIEGFFSAWHDLSRNPAGSVEREQVMYKGKNLLESFDQTKSDMVVVRQNINDTLNAEVNGINRKLRELAQLNADIKQKESLSHVASVDQDERDLLVKELSKTMGIQTFDAGESQIGAQLPGGIPLVEGDTAMEFQSYHDNGELRFRIKSGDITLPVDKDNFGGQFKGLLDIRDEFIPDLQERVNTLAYNIVTQVNARHEDGFGLDGGTGRSFFSKQASFRSQNGFRDPEDLAFNTGSLDIVLNVGTSAESRTEVAIEQGGNSLNGIRDAINKADAGVLASVVPDSSGAYHLDLTPEKQGDAVTIAPGSLAEDDEYSWSMAGGFAQQSDFVQHGNDTYTDPDMASFNKGEIALETGPTGSSTTYNVSIGDGQNTLNGIKEAINASDAGVHATIGQDGASGEFFLAVEPPEKPVSVSGTDTETGAEFSIDQYFSSRSEPLSGDVSLDFAVTEADGTQTDVSVDPPADSSLEDIRDAINGSTNASDAGIHARIKEVGSSYKLDVTAYEELRIDTSALSDNQAYGFANLQQTAGAEELEVAVRDTGAVAAAGRSGGASGDNENALAIHSLAEAKAAEDNKTFVDSYGRIASVVGTETNRNKMATNGAEDTMTQLENLRESTVGVSIEEEMINLTMFQKGFEASSRYVQTIDEMLGTIIGLKR